VYSATLAIIASNFDCELPSNGSIWLPLPGAPSLRFCIQISATGEGRGLGVGVALGVGVGDEDGEGTGVAVGVGDAETMVRDALLGAAILYMFPERSVTETVLLLDESACVGCTVTVAEVVPAAMTTRPACPISV
jgi:hypothetical protein